MKTLLFALLFSFTVALPTHAVEGRPTAITFIDSGLQRNIYAFVKGDNGHLVSNRFNGSLWTWTDHGLPPGSTSISNPKAVTYVDEGGNRRIYVFAVDNTGQLVVRFHKGAGFNWQWSKQGGPTLVARTLSATTFVDDAGVRRLYAFSFTPNNDAIPFKLVTNFWNGNAWNWMTLPDHADHKYLDDTFTEVTNYIGNDGRRRMDVFTGAGTLDKVLRHSWIEAVWNVSNLNGQAQHVAAAVNYLDTSGNRKVHTFVWHPAYQTIWNLQGALWGEIGIPEAAKWVDHGNISATTYPDAGGFPRMNVFVEWGRRLYLRQWSNANWQPWVSLDRPSSAQVEGVRFPFAINYADFAGTQNTWVFMVGGPQNSLYVSWWNGSSWQWYSRGNP